MTVSVVHPQVQHAHQVALALAEAGILEQFVTSCRFSPRLLGLLPVSLRRELSKRCFPGIPAAKVVTFPFAEIAWKLSGRFVQPATRERLHYYNVWLFDRVMSKRVAKSPSRIVVGYENSCLEMFRAAKNQGKFCVLDAASVHYQTQREVYSPPYPAAFLDRINDRKEAEIRLADHILTLSNYAKETYVRAGVPTEKITVIPLGVDCGKFQMSARQHVDGFTFLFVGNIKYSKGIDLLLKAFATLDIPGKQLVIIGAAGDASHLLAPLPAGVVVKGHMLHEELNSEYNRADVFVLPSRLEGFGLVVAEAMATGTPVIVSSSVGAKDLVRMDETGWIFSSGDEQSLAECMYRAFERRPVLDSMGAAARKAVKECSWEAYRKSISIFYQQLLEKLN